MVDNIDGRFDNAYRSYRRKNEQIEADQLAHPVHKYGRAADNSDNRGNYDGHGGQKPGQAEPEKPKSKQKRHKIQDGDSNARSTRGRLVE